MASICSREFLQMILGKHIENIYNRKISSDKIASKLSLTSLSESKSFIHGHGVIRPELMAGYQSPS